jgi:hypothetical protein
VYLYTLLLKLEKFFYKVMFTKFVCVTYDCLSVCYRSFNFLLLFLLLLCVALAVYFITILSMRYLKIGLHSL